jgi:large subunit ribosomal protein L10
MSNLKNQQEIRILTEKFRAMKGLILTEYRGLTVEEFSELRLKLRSFNSEYTVVKNTLSRIALKEAGVEVDKNFSGPIALVIENEGVVSPAKVIFEFAKIHPALKIKAGFFEGKFVDVSIIEQLSNLPSREVLIAKLLYGMSIPVTGFINVLAANIRRFSIVLSEIAKKREITNM